MLLPELSPTAVMSTVIFSILLAVAFSLFRNVTYIPQMISTIIHETGHAISVIPFGGRISGVKLRMNTAGEATVSIPRYGAPLYQIVRIINLLAGYSGPIYFALLVTLTVAAGWVTAQYVILSVLALILILFSRNLFGFLVATIFLGLAATVIFVAPALLPAYLMFLGACSLIAGVRDIVQVVPMVRTPLKTKTTYVRDRKGKRIAQQEVIGPNTDFHIATTELGGTPTVWFGVFLVVHIPLWLACMSVVAYITLDEFL